MTILKTSTVTQLGVSAQGTLKSSFSGFGIVWVTIAMFGILAVTTPGFVGVDNLLNVLDQQSIVLIVAAPLTLVLIVGHFDVSVSAVFITAPLVGIQLENASGSIPRGITLTLLGSSQR